jgi:ABC-2 type transport system permease protein
MTKKQHTVIASLSILIMVLLILLSRRLWIRMDMTSSKAYTLSPASRNLHNEIEETMRITYYLSSKLLSIDPSPSEITDILREYEARSRGKIKVTVKDPGKEAQDAEHYGLYSQQLQNIEQGEASFSVVYSGIVIEYLNRYEALPWVFSLDTLEYDLTSRIRSLVNGKQRELGVIAPEYQKSWSEYYGFFNQTLTQGGFSVLQLRPGEEIPDTLPALFVLGGAEELEETALYRIDRYIQLGGRVFFAVESVDVDFTNTWQGRFKEDKGLLAMISFYGATVGPSLVLDKASLLLPFRDPMNQQFRMIRYAPWVGVMEDRGNKTHPLTSGFGGLDLFWACPLTLTLPESGAVRGEALFTSSPEAWLMTGDFVLRPDQSAMFAYGADESRGEQILAAALEGKFPSWFAGVEKPGSKKNQSAESEADSEDDSEDDFDAAEELPDMPAAPKDSRIIVVGDSDIAGSLIQYTQSQQSINLNFLLQAADWLGNDDDIVGIRNRKSGTGRLDRITDDDKRSALMKFSRILNVFLVPIAIIIFGIYRLVKRNRRKELDHGL